MQDLQLNRIEQLRTKLQSENVDVILISKPENIRYLSGFENEDSNAAFLLITQTELFLVTDYRYSQQASNECPLFEIIERDRQNISLTAQFLLLLNGKPISTLAFEQEHLTFTSYQNIAKAFDKINLIPIPDWISEQRMHKAPTEITAIKKAANIADKALEQLVNFMQPSMTEKDAALELEYQMQKAGSEGLSFPTILISGAKTALPHGMPSEKTMDYGDLITIDFGAVVNGYRSDMTRAFVVGEPTDKQLAVYQTVRNAQQAGLDAVRAEVQGNVPHIAAKAVLDASEFAKFQGEGLGHGVGLALHEQPFLNQDCRIILKPNMVITIEPGIYIPGWGGVRVEDDIAVTENGFEMLTHAPRDLVQIG